jgi:large subunit ribosomal protein L33
LSRQHQEESSAGENAGRSKYMANKKGNRIVIKLKSTESGHTYTTEKNRRNDPSRIELRRYDPIVRRHVTYRETK